MILFAALLDAARSRYAGPEEAVLDCRELEKSFSGVPVLRDVSLAGVSAAKMLGSPARTARASPR